MVITRRITRAAGEVTPVVWTTGELAGRSQVIVATAYAGAPQWWRINLAPLGEAWDGLETGGSGAQTIQGASSWARVKVGDGVTPAAYVSWPAAGGAVSVFGASVEVSALPVVSALVVGAVGPSWAVTIDDMPLDDSARDEWLGLQYTPDVGVLLVGGAGFNTVVPPFARAVWVSTATVGDSGLAVLQRTSRNVSVVSAALVSALPARVELHPACCRVRVVNNGVPTIGGVHVWYEVAP
jgi:hypothetical protein